MSSKKWTEDEIETLVLMAINCNSVFEIAQKLGRSERAVSLKLNKLHQKIHKKELAARPQACYVPCPFFVQYESQRKIRCEGIVEEYECNNVICFSSANNCKSYVCKYCNLHFEDCRVYKSIYGKYSKESAF